MWLSLAVPALTSIRRKPLNKYEYLTGQYLYQRGDVLGYLLNYTSFSEAGQLSAATPQSLSHSSVAFI